MNKKKSLTQYKYRKQRFLACRSRESQKEFSFPHSVFFFKISHAYSLGPLLSPPSHRTVLTSQSLCLPFLPPGILPALGPDGCRTPSWFPGPWVPATWHTVVDKGKKKKKTLFLGGVHAFPWSESLTPAGAHPFPV